MAAKKKKTAKKTATKTYGNKTKFVLGLSRDLSAKQVVEEAKKNGIAITEAHVYKIRSTAKNKTPKAAPKGAPAARGAAKSAPAASSGGSQSKRDFVLSFGPDTKASEILRKAKEQGIGLSKAYLYTIRSAGGASQKRGPKAAAPKGRVANVVRSASNFANHEAQFVEAAIHVGLAKASDLLDRLRARLKSGL
jgi:type III secretion system FlhB-like substrate exporter